MSSYDQDSHSRVIVPVLRSFIRKLLAWEGTGDIQMLGLAKILNALARFPEPTPGASVQVTLRLPAMMAGDSTLRLAWDIAVSEGGIGAAICGSMDTPGLGPDSLTVVEWDAFPGEVSRLHDHSGGLGIADLPKLDMASLTAMNLSDPGHELDVVDHDHDGDRAVSMEEVLTVPAKPGFDGEQCPGDEILARFDRLWAWNDARDRLEYHDDGHDQDLVSLLQMDPVKGKKVRQVDLSGSLATDEGLRLVGRLFPNLRSLNLRFAPHLSGEGILHLPASLEELVLSENHLPDAAWEHLARLTSLKVLRLNGTNFPDSALARLAGFSSLTELDLGSAPVTDEGLRILAGLANLESLDLSGTSVTDQGLSHITGLVKIRSINLSDTGITGEGLSILTGLTNLSSLSLASTGVTDDGLGCLEKLGNLSRLSLSQTGVTDLGMVRLTGLANLESLDLSETGVTDAGVPLLSSFKRLSCLGLSNTKITDDSLRFLARLGGLSALELRGTDVTDLGLSHLAGISCLKSISLCQTRVSDLGLAHLGCLENLESLDLSWTGTTSAGLHHLVNLTRLVSLDLANTAVTADGLRAISSLPMIRDLNVSETLVTPDEISLLTREFHPEARIRTNERESEHLPGAGDFDLPF